MLAIMMNKEGKRAPVMKNVFQGIQESYMVLDCIPFPQIEFLSLETEFQSAFPDISLMIYENEGYVILKMFAQERFLKETLMEIGFLGAILSSLKSVGINGSCMLALPGSEPGPRQNRT